MQISAKNQIKGKVTSVIMGIVILVAVEQLMRMEIPGDFIHAQFLLIWQ